MAASHKAILSRQRDITSKKIQRNQRRMWNVSYIVTFQNICDMIWAFVRMQPAVCSTAYQIMRLMSAGHNLCAHCGKYCATSFRLFWANMEFLHFASISKRNSIKLWYFLKISSSDWVRWIFGQRLSRSMNSEFWRRIQSYCTGYCTMPPSKQAIK